MPIHITLFIKTSYHGYNPTTKKTGGAIDIIFFGTPQQWSKTQKKKNAHDTLGKICSRSFGR